MISEILRGMASDVAQVNRDNGWYEEYRTFGEDNALLTSEVSEMLEAHRDGLDLDHLEFVVGTHTDLYGETHKLKKVVRANDPLVDKLVETHGPGKPVGVASECADVLIRLLDTCYRYDIDLGGAYHAKLAYNATRARRHGGKKL